jgi:hypothetical protein
MKAHDSKMNPNAPQGIARLLISEADHLSRLAYGDGEGRVSALFAALRTELASIERRCGANPPRRVSNVEIETLQTHVRDAVIAATGREPHAALERFRALAERLHPPRLATLVGFAGGRA